MKKFISPSRISGTIEAPPSKSMTQRAVAVALLSEGVTTILNPSHCDDALSSMRLAEALGASIALSPHEIKLSRRSSAQRRVLDCGESGLCLRLFAPIAALTAQEHILTGTGSLRTRPISMIEAPLRELGATCATRRGYPPATITGPLRGGTVHVDGSVTSQFLSGLLIALPVLDRDSRIIVSNLVSRPYVDMTLAVLNVFGVTVQHFGYETFEIPGGQKYISHSYAVEGDWSGASFFFVAAAIGGSLCVDGLDVQSTQGDKAILGVLRGCGAVVEERGNRIAVSAASLKAFEFDAHEMPDLVPPLSVLACNCDGLSIIRGMGRLRHKESDRALILQTELQKLGADIVIEGDHMAIRGTPLHGGIIDTHHDHRMAMAATIAAITSHGTTTIRGAECVQKSYPNFFRDCAHIGVTLHE